MAQLFPGPLTYLDYAQDLVNAGGPVAVGSEYQVVASTFSLAIVVSVNLN